MQGRSPRRQAQFATARACARRALADLGLPPAPILPGPGGAPQWPVGTKGSITHCDGYRAAVVSRSELTAGLGIDAEPAMSLPDGVMSLVASPRELTMLAAMPSQRPQVPWDRLLFCAKEAAYKSWYPQSGRWSALRDIQVDIDDAGGFVGLLPGPEPMQVTGRWRVTAGLLLTAVARPAAASA